MPKVLIGTILYQSDLNLFAKCIEMFFHQRWDKQPAAWDFALIILDNDNGNQIKDVQTLLKKRLSAKQLACIHYQASENIGFGQGHNLIFKTYAQKFNAKYYLCVNPDGIPHPNMLQAFQRFTQKVGKPALFEARQFPVEHPKVYHPQSGETQWASGCCLLVPSELFRELNGFDPDFFMYMEDVDLSWRARIKGYLCYTVHDALFHHYKVGETGLKALPNLLMLKSGYLLSEKYAANNLKLIVWNELCRHLKPSELDELQQEALRFRKANYQSIVAERPEIFNFERGFYFSEVRWQ